MANKEIGEKKKHVFKLIIFINNYINNYIIIIINYIYNYIIIIINYNLLLSKIIT